MKLIEVIQLIQIVVSSKFPPVDGTPALTSLCINEVFRYSSSHQVAGSFPISISKSSNFHVAFINSRRLMMFSFGGGLLSPKIVPKCDNA